MEGLITDIVQCFGMLADLTVRKLVRFVHRTPLRYVFLCFCLIQVFVLVLIFIYNKGKFNRYGQYIDMMGISGHMRDRVTRFRHPAAESNRTADHWQPVTRQGDAFVFSAYIDKNFEDEIRILGAISRKSDVFDDVICIMWYDDVKKTRVIAKADVDLIDKWFFKQYLVSHVFFVCPIRGLAVPMSVSVTTGLQWFQKPNMYKNWNHKYIDTAQAHTTLNVLNIHTPIRSSPRFNLTACVSPIFCKNISDLVGIERNIDNLVEWIETNRVLGVEMFTVYVHSIDVSRRKVLEYYRSLNIMEIVNWTLYEKRPKYPDKPVVEDVFYYEQLAAVNDCLHRNKGRSVHTMMTDLDEIIFPRKDSTLVEMIHRLPDKAVYSFTHTLHPIDSGLTRSNKRGRVHMLNTFLRSRDIHRGYSYSAKLIYKPDLTTKLSIHFVKATLDYRDTYHVDPETAMLHHYRCCKAFPALTEDRVAEKYIEKVLTNMNVTFNALGFDTVLVLSKLKK